MRLRLSVALPLALVAGLAACQKTGAPTASIALAPGAHAAGELLVVDGSGSRDAQGKPLEYHWRVSGRPAGSRAHLSGDTLSRAVLLPDAEGTYAFELVVSNGVLTATATAEAEVKCGIAAPAVAIAPAPASNRVGSPVVLTATVTDADTASPCGLPQATTISWKFRAMPAGSRSTISGAEGEKPSFVPDVPGTYTLEATAVDSTGRHGSATVDVGVATCGSSAPEISELGATPAVVGSPVKLSATVSDPDAQEACGGSAEFTYAWRLAGIPAGSHATLVGASLETPWFTPDVAGSYVAELKVTDGTGLSASRRITIDASACGGNVPEITEIAASSSAPATGQAVSLTPTVVDADNEEACGAKQTFRLAWRLVSLPAGSAARLSDATALAPSLVPDVPGTYDIEAIATDSTGRSSAPARVTVVAATCGDNAPVASAGADLAANIGQVVQVRGTATDADTDAETCGLSETFSWSWSFTALPAGSHAGLAGRETSTPWFVPDVAGEYELQAVVSDRAGHRSAPASVRVTTATCGGRAPSATVQATPENPGALEPVRLTATATDPDDEDGCALGQALSYAWSFTALPAGSHAAIANPSAAAPFFVPDLAGRYETQVVVTDFTGRSGTASLAVEVSGCGVAAPSVSATVVTTSPSVGLPVLVQATGTDADADAPCSRPSPLAYAWAFDALPAGSSAQLNDAALAAPSFVPDRSGTYVLRVTASDAEGHSATTTVSVSVSSCGSAAPVAQATATPNAPAIGQPVALAASATDADNAPACGRTEDISWQWSFATLPAGSRAQLSSATAASPSFVPDVPGAYALQLVATDSAGHASAPTVVTVTASTCGSASPTATFAASPAAPNTGDRVSLAATASDADNQGACAASQALSYAWSFEALPTGSKAALSAATTALATFVPDVAGTYSLKLVVADGTGRSAIVRQDVTADSCGSSRPVANVTAGSAAVGIPVPLTLAVTDADNGATCQARTPATPVQSFSYAWTLLGGPVGSTAALSLASARIPTLVPDVPGSYVLQVVVTDSTGLDSAPALVTVTVGSCGAAAPVASLAASTSSPNLLQNVQFTLTYTDADESASCTSQTGAVPPVGYAWRLAASPAGSRASLAQTGGATAAIAPDLAGTYTVEGFVTDATGRASRAQASITATGCGRAIPVAAPAVATTPLRLNAPILVKSNATDADNQAPCSLNQSLSYRWTFAEMPAGAHPAFLDGRQKDFSFTPDLAGTYVLSLQVTDSTGRTSTPTAATITVGSCGGSAPVPQIRMTSPSTTSPSANLVVNPLLSCMFQLDARDTVDADAACGLPQTASDLDYRWEEVSAPAGSQSHLSSPSSENPWFPIDKGGTYDFRLVASDGRLWSTTPATARIVHKGFSIASVSPAVSCFGAVPTTLTLTAGGQGFLKLTATNTLPTVTMSPGSATVQGVSGCTPSGVAGVDSCTTMTIQLPLGLVVGNYTITVKNPVQDGCVAQAFYSIGPPPTISKVTPTQVCGADDPLQPDQFSLNVQGSGFLQATQLSLGSNLAVSTTYNSSSNMDAIFNIPAPGTYPVSASNGNLCGSTLSNAVSVLSVPLVFFVDPPVVYNGISTQATAYISGLNGGTITAVRIRPAGSNGALTSLTFTYDTARANQVQLVLPAGLAPGNYEILVTDGATCTSIPVSAIKVTGSLTLALSKIDPPFGATNANTSVDLRALQPAPSGQEGFLSTPPRVYLNPTGSSTGTARALNAVTVVNSGLANAVVKAGIPAGTYDVIVVNSDGAVGLLPAAYRAVTNPPPIIDSVTPGSIPSGTTSNILVLGKNFSNPAFRWDCVDSLGTAATYNVTVSSPTSTSLQVAPPPGVSLGTVCVGVATNTDGTYGEYSALGVTGPSENLGAFDANSPMQVARRAPAVTSARPTRSARFLYAFGGDNGTIAGSMQSAEVAPLDRYGNLGAWRSLPLNLPAPTTLGQAVTVGRYVYLAGGNASGAVTTKAYRALVLDPNAAPNITDLFLQFKSGALGAGTWYYRISAVMGGSDPDNPNGEALPSDPLTVQIPSGLPNTLSATLTWSAVPGAGSYRIYRSPVANAAAGTEQLIGTVSGTSFVDDGKTVTTGVPRKIGDLGVWVSLANMNVTRQGAGMTAARDPSNANIYYVYVVGGYTSAGTVDGTYEYLTLQVNQTTGQQQASTSWIRDTSNTITARTQLSLFNVTDLVTTRVSSGDTWVHAGPGLNAGGSSVNAVDGAKVQAGGLLSSWASESNPTNRAGYVAAAAANQLFIFGGQGGAPSTGGVSAPLCGLGGPCAGPPGLKNWNAGISLSVPRYLAGTVVESAHIFAIGGQSTSAPTNTVESVIW